MRETDLIRCIFDGAALLPDGNLATAQMQDRLGAGQVVLVDLDPERSAKSHKHQFAFVKTAWDNMPEHLKDAPFAKTSETLRKHALISTGFCDVDMIALGEDRRADRMADFLRRNDAREGTYTIINAEGPVIYRYVAESQSLKAMGGARFKKSKQATLEWLAELIGVTADALASMGKKGAA